MEKKRPLRVMVCDDDADMVMSSAKLLSDEGYEVRAAYHGADVLTGVLQFAPDVVLLDIGMPGINGYEVARKLRERYGSARPALIAVTGMTEPLDKRMAYLAGIDHHVGKPYEPRALLQLVGRFLPRPPDTLQP